jgi:hypothetical protein
MQNGQNAERANAKRSADARSVLSFHLGLGRRKAASLMAAAATTAAATVRTTAAATTVRTTASATAAGRASARVRRASTRGAAAGWMVP